MANPSLALVPSGYKATKLYSVLPTDGSGDFTVARASTATRVNSDGLIETVAANVPRIDYTDGSCPVLLTEPQSTNIVLRSQELGTSPWTLTGGAVTNNSAISPDGALNATKIESISGNAGGVLQTLTSLVSGDIYTVSFYGKSGTSDNLCLIINNTAAWNTVGGKVFTSADGLNNSTWTRFEYTFAVSSTSGFNIHIGNHSEVGLTSQYLGDFYVYGVQAEKSSYPTSYIPTAGTTVTRIAETCNDAGNNQVINSTEGVLYFEGSVLDISTSNSWISVSEDANINNNQFNLRFILDSNLIQAVSRAGGLGQDVVLQHTLTDKTTTNKIAIKYKLNDWALWVNGVEVDTETSSVAFTANSLDVLDFDRGNDSNQFYGNIKEVKIYNTALTDQELISLTTI